MEEKLLIEVEKRTVLYDLKHKSYKNNGYRKKIWDEISNELGISSEQCQTIWKRLKVKYIKLFQDNKKTATTAFSKTTPAIIKSMDFLKPFITENNKKSSSAASSKTTPVKIEPKEFLKPFITENKKLLNRSLTSIPPPIPVPIPIHNDESSAPLTGYFSHFDPEKIIEALQTPVEDLDGIDYFCLSIAKDLKNMEPSEQRKIKLKISTVLAEADYLN